MSDGLELRYKVERVDGKNDPVDSEYFVLRLNHEDRRKRNAACNAAIGYAQLCGNMELARDLCKKYNMPMMG